MYPGTCAKRMRMSRIRVRIGDRKREREKEGGKERERERESGTRDGTGRLAYNRGVDIENLSEAK